MLRMTYDDAILREGLSQALVIARQRTEILGRLRQALIDDDMASVRLYASQLCGLHESSGIPESIDTGAGLR